MTIPTATKPMDEPVMPGFERIARVCDQEATLVLVEDFEVSPEMQQLVDECGGEPSSHRRGGRVDAFRWTA